MHRFNALGKGARLHDKESSVPLLDEQRKKGKVKLPSSSLL